MDKNTKNYREVGLNLDCGGFDKAYRNPLTGTFQYEYALYEAVSSLFESVICHSMCIDSLKLYFMELAHRKEDSRKNGMDAAAESGSRRKTQEGLLEEMERLVNRDVIGHITFPMMDSCLAEVRTVPEEDGTHSFIFTDGIYGFRVHFNPGKKGKSKSIEVADLKKERTVIKSITNYRNMEQPEQLALEGKEVMAG